MQQLAEKEALNTKLQVDLDRYRECDPEVIEEVKTQTVVAKEAANRWTGQFYQGFYRAGYSTPEN